MTGAVIRQTFAGVAGKRVIEIRERATKQSAAIRAALGADGDDGKCRMAVTKWGNFTFIDLTVDELEILNQPVNGQGGLQDFMRRLQAQVNTATKTIRLTDEDLASIPHHAFDYGQGGFEARLVNIFGRELGPNLGRE
jgi:hypothetical protein